VVTQRNTGGVVSRHFYFRRQHTVGLHKQTRKLFKHRASGDQLKERKAARKLEHPGQTVKETVTVAPFLQIERENQALRNTGGKDFKLKVDARPAKKRLSKDARKDDGD
jgi:hypothetical protein